MARNPCNRLLETLLMFLSFWSLLACKSSHLRPGQASPAVEASSQLAKSDTRPSEDNGGLPGYPLICQIEDRKIDSAELDCQILTSDGKQMQLEEEFREWQFEFLTNLADLTVIQQPATKPWHVSWHINHPSHIDLTRVIDQSMVNFKGKSINPTLADRDLLWQISESLPLKWESRHAQRFRLVIHSIHTTEFIDPSACITFLQFSANKQWLEASYDETNHSLHLGKYPSTVLTSSNPEYRLEAFFPEGFWESAYGTYSPHAPHAAVTEEPSWIEVDFGDSLIAIDGIRLLGTPENYYYPGECAPDQISLLQSNDGLNWQEVPAVSLLEIDSISMFEKSW